MMTDVGAVPFVSSGSNWGDSGGGIWAILLLALCGRGFGGCGGDYGRGGYSDADSAEINGRFNSLENQIDAVNEQNAIRFNLKEICDGHMATLESKGDIIREVIESKYDLDKSVQSAECDLTKDILNNRFETAIGFKDAQLQLAECCCGVNRNIDAVRFQNAQDTAAVIAAQTAGTQKILDKMCENEKQALRDEIACLRMNVARPAYITNAPGQAVFPPYNAAPYNYGGFQGNSCCC